MSQNPPSTPANDERLKYLEEVHHVHAGVLTLLASLGDFQASINECREPDAILSTARQHIRRLIGFRASAFCLVQEADMNFNLACCEPEEEKNALQERVDHAIADGTFAWALRQNRAVVIRKGQGVSPLVFHVLATRSRVLGMFVGLLPEEEIRRGDLFLHLLSALLLSPAYALENALLSRKIHDYNLNLEKVVQQQTGDLVRANEELIKTKKLESVAVLAGGIAHDFNNMLMVILGNLSLLRSDLPPNPDLLGRLGKIEEAVARAKDLTHQLVTFSKGGEPVRQRAALAPLIRDSAELAIRGTHSRCEFDLPEDLPPLQLDSNQIRQVFMNVVMNAAEAMPDGGTIRIRASNLCWNGEDNLPLRRGYHVKISIQDEGPGIPPENLGRIFDPYFTAKGGHSGLGLSIAYSIVKKHGGCITVESAAERGSTFHIHLPVLHEAPSAPRASPHPSSGSSKRILVMDDEEPIRTLLGEMLTALGYEPAFACDGREAIAAYRQALDQGPRFAAVIMDLTIPFGMGGKEAMEELLKLDPHVRVIISSGHSQDPVMSDFARHGFSGVIPKPYEIGELGRILTQLTA